MFDQIYAVLALLGTMLLMVPVALWPVLEERLVRGTGGRPGRTR